MTMSRQFKVWLSVFVAVAMLAAAAYAQAPGAAKPKLYNNVKQKLLDGKQVFCSTQTRFDPDAYCEAAKHFDYTWFDLQHSTLTFGEVEKMIGACPNSIATPIVRVPDAQEWMIQQATDLGALGIIVPTVDDAEKARTAARYVRYPPIAHRSTGMAQATRIWPNYRATANDNMLLIVMLETPVAVANAYEIASVPGVDVVLVGNNDLTQFSGYPATDDRYLDLLTKIRDATLKAGKIFGQANASFATGHPLSKDAKFFQNGSAFDGWTPPGGRGGAGGGAPKKK